MLDASQAHHLRDVLRLTAGTEIELFDDVGSVAHGVVTAVDPARVSIRVESIEEPKEAGDLIIASAVPKGDRADWMIEKLSELGVTRFIPLQTERSVVHPTGVGKRDRWMRIATESAKQSRRAGVMKIDELARLSDVIEFRGVGASPMHRRLEPPARGRDAHATWYFSTAADAVDLRNLVDSVFTNLALFIGPEGGWTDAEMALFGSANLTGVKLTATILRVETAAIAAAAIAATLLVRR